MIDPVGTTWWWHLADVEQQMYRQAVERESELRRELLELKHEVGQIRTVAKNRCAHHGDHRHSMIGLVE